MNTIEQAKQVVELLKDGQAGDCSPIGNRYAAIETINALVAELATIKDAHELVAAAMAVMVHEANVLKSQKPVARFNWNKGGFEWLAEYSYDKHNMKPLFLAAGAQPAPVPESACRVCIYLHKGECGHSHGPLNPRGDYCGGQVLTSKAKMEPVQAQERKSD